MIESISFNTLRPTAAAPASATELLDDDAEPGMLRLGSTGDAVKALQQQLNALGEQLPVNGNFGPRTLEAVRRFQLARALSPANGVVNTATARALSGPEQRTSWGLTFREPIDSIGQVQPHSTTPATGDNTGGGSELAALAAKPRRGEEWFSEAAQRPAAAPVAAAPSTVTLVLVDGRSLTVEQALRVMNDVNAQAYGAAGEKVAAYGRAMVVSEVNQLSDKLMQKGYFTAPERLMVARSIKGAIDGLGQVGSVLYRVERILSSAPGTPAVTTTPTAATASAAQRPAVQPAGGGASPARRAANAQPTAEVPSAAAAASLANARPTAEVSVATAKPRAATASLKGPAAAGAKPQSALASKGFAASPAKSKPKT